MSLLKFSLSAFVKILHFLSRTESARPPCVLWLFPWSNVHLSVLLWIGQLSFFLLAVGYSKSRIRLQQQHHSLSSSQCCLYKLLSSSVYCVFSFQSPMHTAAWWVVRSTAPSWLRTTPNYVPCCSLCASTTELTSLAPTQDDPGRTPFCCWMGESPSKTGIG